MLRRKFIVWDKLLLLSGTIFIVAAVFVVNRPVRPVLTIWSCGSNYESIRDFSHLFEEKYNCKVRYSAAPVQFLLERAMAAERPPDIIVGRAGPGWEALRQAGQLAHGPRFFAMDPYVIITPRGNSANICGIEDLGRDGVRVAASPLAMRPRGKCPSHLMAAVSEQYFPGLCERWENNFTVIPQCGRKLGEPVAGGEVDAAIVPLCMTSWPELHDKIEVIPIEPKYLLAMKQCRATIPQCAGVLTGSKQPELARSFVDELVNGIGKSVIIEHGYLPIDSPEAQALADLMEVFLPQDMPGWQMHMGIGLYQDGALASALRRFLLITQVFGPTRYDAQARFWAGKCLQAMGENEAARLQWKRVVNEFPRRGKVEYDSDILDVGTPVPGVEKLNEKHWVEQARKALRELPTTGDFSTEHERFLSTFTLTHEPVVEGDPDKNGTRNLQLGKDLLAMGRYAAAMRDLLKVQTIDYPSRHVREAGFWLGVASCLRGMPDIAAGHWEQLATGDDNWAKEAARALEMIHSHNSASTVSTYVEMPPWHPQYDTHTQRAMSYGMELWRHQMTLYCFKEMAKILSGVYGEPGEMAPMARYRMGVACLALDRPEAAHSQWSLLQRCYSENEFWIGMAHEAQAAIKPEQRKDLPFVQKYKTAKAVEDLKQPPKTSFGKRFRGAEELFNAGLFDDDQCLLEYWKVMTVTDPSQKRNREIRPIAQYKAGLCCRATGRESAARRHFMNVVEKYPEHQAAKMAAAALAEGES